MKLGISGSGLCFNDNGIWTLKGVASFVNSTIVFTDVSQHINWLSSITKKYSPDSFEETTLSTTSSTTTTTQPTIIVIE